MLLTRNWEHIEKPPPPPAPLLPTAPKKTWALRWIKSVCPKFSLAYAMLPAADYDLTGQILWPAALLLAEYLVDRTEVISNKRAACELGSGLGLVGLFCGQFCDTILTDHNEVVLRVLQENAENNKSLHQLRCASALTLKHHQTKPNVCKAYSEYNSVPPSSFVTTVSGTASRLSHKRFKWPMLPEHLA